MEGGKNRQAKNWCFMVANYTAADELVLQKMCLDEDVAYMCYGYETCPTTGTLHLQGHMQCFNPSGMYYNTLRSKLKCWWGVTRGKPHQADAYARGLSHGKQPNRVWEFGVMSVREENLGNPNASGAPGNVGNPVGNPGNVGNPKARGPSMQERMERNKRLRSETMDDLCNTGEISVMQVRGLKNARLDLREELRSSGPVKTIDGPLDNFWFCGRSGTGKSREARLRWPFAYGKNCNKWFCGYDGQATVLIEDFDRKHDVLCHHLKIWADRYPFTAEVKQGNTGTIRPDRIVITSNYHPRDIWHDEGDLEPILRRFKVVNFDSTFNPPRELPPQERHNVPMAFAETFNAPDREPVIGGDLPRDPRDTEDLPTLIYVPPTERHVPSIPRPSLILNEKGAEDEDPNMQSEEDPDTQEETDSDTDDDEPFDLEGVGSLLEERVLAAACVDLFADDDDEDDFDDLDEFLATCSPFTYDGDAIDLTSE